MSQERAEDGQGSESCALQPDGELASSGGGEEECSGTPVQHDNADRVAGRGEDMSGGWAVAEAISSNKPSVAEVAEDGGHQVPPTISTPSAAPESQPASSSSSAGWGGGRVKGAASPSLTGGSWGIPSASSLNMLPSISLSSWFAADTTTNNSSMAASRPSAGISSSNNKADGLQDQAEVEEFRAFLHMQADAGYGRGEMEAHVAASNPPLSPPQASGAASVGGIPPEAAGGGGCHAGAKAWFLQFMEKLQGAGDLKEHVRSSISNFQLRYPRGGKHDGNIISTAISTLMSSLETRMAAHPHWRGQSEDEMEQAREGLEKLVVVKLFDHLWRCDSSDESEDAQLCHRLSRLSFFLIPDHLDVPKALQDVATWKAARTELGKMSAFKAPRDKLVCIHNCCRVLSNRILTAHQSSEGEAQQQQQQQQHSASADDLLPMLIFTLIGSECATLHSQLAFISRFRHPDRKTGQLAYFHTLVMSAITFLSDICDEDGKLTRPGALSIDKDEFREGYLSSGGRPVPAKAREKARELTESEKVAEAVRSGEQGELELFKWRGSSVQSLKVRDVGDLLEQYHAALRVIEQLSTRGPG